MGAPKSVRSGESSQLPIFLKADTWIRLSRSMTECEAQWIAMRNMRKLKEIKRHQRAIGGILEDIGLIIDPCLS